MKYFPLIITCLLILHPAFGVEPKTLEEALLNYPWEWIHAPMPPDRLIFTKDGMAKCDRFSWHWKITGPTTALGYDATMHDTGKRNAEFTVKLTFTPDFRMLRGKSSDNKLAFFGRRLASKAPQSSLVAGANNEAFTQALMGYKWSWNNGVNFKNARFQLLADGLMKWTSGSLVEVDTWRITGTRTIHIDYVDGKFADLTFSDDVSSFSGLNWHNDWLRGVKTEVLGNDKSGTPANGSAISWKSIQTDANQPRIEVIKDQGPNSAEWALTPLDEAIPADIRQNLTFLREDLLDEGKRAAKASPEAYKLASDYCDKLLTALDQRDVARANAGYAAAQADANKRTSNQALDARRNYKMSWPQFSREESQRAALRENETDKADVKKQRLKVEWTTRAVQMRSYLDGVYRQLREAMR